MALKRFGLASGAAKSAGRNPCGYPFEATNGVAA